MGGKIGENSPKFSSVPPPYGGEITEISPQRLSGWGGKYPKFPPRGSLVGGENKPDFGGSPPYGGGKGALANSSVKAPLGTSISMKPQEAFAAGH